jgi:peroxiredoxin
MKGMVLLFMICLSFSIFAQTQVQNFTLVNVADGTNVSLDQYSSSAGLVLIFTSNACPYDGYYRERIKTLIKTYEGKIQFILINSHQDAAETAEKMKSAFDTWGLSVPYLSDKDQVAMEQLGARKSPEVFLLKHVNDKYNVLFSGAFDDNPQVASGVNQQYLRSAVDQHLGGHKIEVPLARAVGCSIRKK